MIYIITGKTGHGKTAFMVKWARDILKSGGKVYSNIKIYPESMRLKTKPLEADILDDAARENPDVRILYWQNFSDWALMKDGTILCDEGLVYFNARKWESLPDTMQMKFVQHRKDKLDLVVNVQHYSFIDKTLRVLCERFINVELKIGSAQFKKTLLPRIARVVDIDLPTLNRCENLGIDAFNASLEDEDRYNIQVLSKEWFWIRKKIFRYYDTSVQVLESRPEPLRHFQRICSICNKVEIRHA